MVSSHAYADKLVAYSVGQYVYDVPSKNVASKGFLDVLRSLLGMDSEVDSFLFETERSFSGGLYLTNEVERESYKSTDRFAQFWYAQSHYSDREIIFHENSGFYLGFDSVGYRGTFTVYKINPEVNKDLPKLRESVYVADCSGSSVSELKNVTCNRQLILDDVLVHFSFHYEELSEVMEIESEVISSIIDWRREIKFN